MVVRVFAETGITMRTCVKNDTSFFSAWGLRKYLSTLAEFNYTEHGDSSR